MKAVVARCVFVLCSWYFARAARDLPAVQAGSRLKGTPVYPDGQGGLAGFTDLGPLLPRRKYQRTATGQASDCYHDKDECGDAGSQYSSIARVKYDDAADPITLCICSEAAFTLESLAQAVGQVPLFLRKTVKSYTAVPDRAPHAYTVAGQITLFGKTSENVFIHESAHAYDGKFKLSGQQAYLQALSADSCVPDEYAQNNNVECFAQDMVVFLYYLWKPNFSRASCLSQQIKFVSDLETPGFLSYKDSVDNGGKRKLLSQHHHGEQAQITIAAVASG